jgi:Na+/melibiose symporter-like transporter
MAEIFTNQERPKVSQWQNTFNYVGNGIMALFSLLILTDYVGDLKSDINSPIPSIYLIPVIIFGVLTIVLFYIIAFKLPTEPHYQIKSSMKENLKTILNNKNFMYIILMVGISGLGWSMITETMLKYAQDALLLSGIDYIIIALLLLISIFIFLYIWRVLIEKKGKKETLSYIFILGAVFMPITLLGFIPMDSYLLLGGIFIIGIAAILGGWYLFPYIVYADVAEDDQKKTNELKAGIYTGFPSIILNIFQAAGVFLIGAVLSIPIYYRDVSIGMMIWGPIVSVILVISYLYTKKYVSLDFEWEEKQQLK